MADKKEITQNMIDEELVKWVLGTVEPWEEYREVNFEDDWKEYYREWKGIWSEDSKSRQSERSKFIAPALAQAIEMAVADMEEATFNKRYWIDISDDIQDTEKSDYQFIRNQLIEDFEIAGITKSISEVYLNGAIYGTGIGKVVVSEKSESFTSPRGELVDNTRIEVSLEPVSPWDFAIDPAARNVNEGLGCAHIPIKSKVDILKKINEGIYNDVPLGEFTDDEDVATFGEKRSTIAADRVEIIEYHGLVPSALLMTIEDEVTADLAEDIYDLDESDMVEAIVTIANRTALLKAVVNPFIYLSLIHI